MRIDTGRVSGKWGRYKRNNAEHKNNNIYEIYTPLIPHNFQFSSFFSREEGVVKTEETEKEWRSAVIVQD